MVEKEGGRPPCWLFTILMVGGLVTGGLYLGMIRVEGVSTGLLIRAIGFSVFGLLMLWGVLARR